MCACKRKAAVVKLGVANLNEGRFDAALTIFSSMRDEAMAEAKPRRAAAAENLMGITFQAMGRPDLAAGHFRRALDTLSFHGFGDTPVAERIAVNLSRVSAPAAAA